MATSRRTATNENVSTYGTGKDYTALATWEAAKDVDMVSATQSEILEVYNEEFDDYIGTIAGGITNSSYFRIIRPASGEFGDGTIGTAPRFYYTTAAYFCQLDEDYFLWQDIEIKLTVALSALNVIIHMQSDEAACVGVIVANSVTTNSQDFYGIAQNSAGNTNYMVNCMTYNNDSGDEMYSMGNFNGTLYAYNNTTVDNTGVSPAAEGFRNNTGTTNLKNHQSSGHGSNKDINEDSGVINFTTCNPAVEGSAGDEPTFVNKAGGDLHLAAGDTVCRGNATDLSADGNFAFDDDIDLTTRSAWDIGFDEFEAVGDGSPWNYYAQQ